MTEKIRFATTDDAATLLEIYAPYVMETTITYEYEVPTTDEFSERISSIKKKFPYLVYVVDGKIAGYAYANTFRTRQAFQWDVETSVYVKEEFHHKKVAYKLYTALFALLKEQGFYNVYSYISVPNEKSTRFHKKFDFKEVALYEKTGYKLGRWCNLSCMAKSLLPITETTIPNVPVLIQELDPAFVSQVLTRSCNEEGTLL